MTGGATRKLSWNRACDTAMSIMIEEPELALRSQLVMDEITLRDFRCFRGRQTARLAPLTLVVGENSTGKTSFLAIIRALWEIASNHSVPDFKEEPYDLGSFAEIAHHRGGRAGRAETFEAGFHIGETETPDRMPYSFNVTFGQLGTAPMPVIRRVRTGSVSVQVEQMNGSIKLTATTANGSWENDFDTRWWGGSDETSLVPMYVLGMGVQDEKLRDGDNKLGDEDEEAIWRLLRFRFLRGVMKPFASAPVRSRPRRTYDPARPVRDSEGDYVPMYLAHLFRHQNKREWSALKERLEAFGSAAGLFDELSIKSLGVRESEPFQVQVRKRGKRAKGPWRNLIDVGYGVSQVLPLITELLRRDAPATFLLQQPEVHLHPSAQAALGSLFCEVAKSHQLIVETHSDHLINRICMDVRDRVGPLKPEDISILYFERQELEVQIHSLRIDQDGNVMQAPPSYGQFFVDEVGRSLRY